MNARSKPVVIITGAGGDIGSALAKALKKEYRVVGLDLEGSEAPVDCIAIDITSDDSVELAFQKVRKRYGDRIASVVHLAAYFDFTGEDSPLYRTVNVEGTRRLLRALQGFKVEQFVYSGTMLVHAPCEPGQHINEDTPLAPTWAYPQSKAATEEVIRQNHGDIPYVLLHIAGLYDETKAIPTLAHQIARIYERNLKSHFYPGDGRTGQAFIHRDDLIDAFRRTVDRRAQLPSETTILLGESDVMSFDELQNELGQLIHGAETWATIKIPKVFARTAAWAEVKSEPVVPDAIDRGEKPFIRPFLVSMADQHYALDISRARDLLGWAPRHHIRDALPGLVAALKHDPIRWHEANGVTLPAWMETAADVEKNPELLRRSHEERYREAHRRHLWAHFLNLGAGSWLLTAGPLLGYQSAALLWSDALSGLAVLLFATLSLSWRFGWVRWATAAVGLWLLFAPLVFWAPTAAAYLNDTIMGALVIGLAVLTRPVPGQSPVAALTRPTIPPGWDFSPSSWFQRIPIIVLAFVGLHISRYLTAYQLGHIEGVWDPFFAGGPEPTNGTEEVISSSVSKAWPVPDAGVGAVTYMLEILTGVIGSARRWRTMPWLVVLFGILIVPLGVVSITFIIIQPIIIGTWCTLCLIAAAAMLLQIPYSLDELVATSEFLWRRAKRGESVIRVFFVGDTDKGTSRAYQDNFEQPPSRILSEMLTGGISVPWNLLLCVLIGIWLMFTRLTVGATGGMADADHLIGSLVITVTVTAFAEVARPIRFLNIALGLALCITPFILGAPWLPALSGLACGIALIALSIRRGPIRSSYGGWSGTIV